MKNIHYFILVLSIAGIVQMVGATTPIADFQASCNYRTIQFTDASIGNPNCWHWNFGDGSSSTQQNPTHTYNSDGHYTVTLDVGVDGQFLSSTSKTMDAFEIIQSRYTVNITSGIAPLAVQFTDMSIGNPDKWMWELSNDRSFRQRSQEQNPTFLLTEPGQYALYLRVEKTGSIYMGSQNWFNIITVALPYTGTTTGTSTATATTTTVATTASTSTTTTMPTTTTTATATTTTVATTASTSTTTTSTTVPTITTTNTPTATATTYQTTIPTTVMGTTTPITTVSTPTKKPTTMKTYTPIPTYSPTQASPIGIETVLFAICIIGFFILPKRQ